MLILFSDPCAFRAVSPQAGPFRPSPDGPSPQTGPPKQGFFRSTSQTSLPSEHRVTQALSGPLTFRLAFLIRVTLSERVPSGLSPQTGSLPTSPVSSPPLPSSRRGKRVKITPTLSAPRALALHPQAGATIGGSGSVALGCGHSEHVGLKTETQVQGAELGPGAKHSVLST